MKAKGFVPALLALSFFTTPSFASECPSVLKFMKRKLNSQETVNLCNEYARKDPFSGEHSQLLRLHATI